MTTTLRLESRGEGDEPVHDEPQDGGADDTAEEDFDAASEREERESALDDALAGIGMDDEMPEPVTQQSADRQTADYEEITYGDTVSFYDRLKEQMVDVELTPKQREIMGVHHRLARRRRPAAQGCRHALRRACHIP